MSAEKRKQKVEHIHKMQNSQLYGLFFYAGVSQKYITGMPVAVCEPLKHINIILRDMYCGQ